MKNFLIQVEFLPHSDQARISLTPIKPDAQVIVQVVPWEDAHQAASELLDEAFGVRKPDKSRMLFDGIIGETEARLLRDLERYSGA